MKIILKNQTPDDTLLVPSLVNLERRRSSGKLFDNLWEIQLRPVQKEKKQEEPKVFFKILLLFFAKIILKFCCK